MSYEYLFKTAASALTASAEFIKQHQLVVSASALLLLQASRGNEDEPPKRSKRKRKTKGNKTKTKTKKRKTEDRGSDSNDTTDTDKGTERDTSEDETDSDSETDSEDDQDKKLSKGWKTNAPDIEHFNGKSTEWSRWKMNTITILYGLGYRKILTRRKHAKKQKVRNRMLFTLLHAALRGGHSDGITFNLSSTQDGNKAWKELVQYYEGDSSVSAGVATRLKDQLRNCVMVPGVSAEEYVNKFSKLYSQVQQQPRFKLDPDEAKQWFVNNIKDEDYRILQGILHGGLNTKSMSSLISELRTYELSLDRTDRFSKRTRRINGNRIRRATQGETENDGTASLPSVLHPNTIGIINIQPSSDWYALKKEHKTFLQTYNAAIRHKKDLPSPPDGITIGDRRDDGIGNTDIKGRWNPPPKSAETGKTE